MPIRDINQAKKRSKTMSRENKQYQSEMYNNCDILEVKVDQQSGSVLNLRKIREYIYSQNANQFKSYHSKINDIIRSIAS